MDDAMTSHTTKKGLERNLEKVLPNYSSKSACDGVQLMAKFCN